MEPIPIFDLPSHLHFDDSDRVSFDYLHDSEVLSSWSGKEVEPNIRNMFGTDVCPDPHLTQSMTSMQRFMVERPPFSPYIHEADSRPLGMEFSTARSSLLQHQLRTQLHGPPSSLRDRHLSPDGTICSSSSGTFSASPSDGVGAADWESRYSHSPSVGRRHEQRYLDFLPYSSHDPEYLHGGGSFVAPQQIQAYPDSIPEDHSGYQSPDTRPETSFQQQQVLNFHQTMERDATYSEERQQDPHLFNRSHDEDDPPSDVDEEGAHPDDVDADGEPDSDPVDSDLEYKPTPPSRTKHTRGRSSQSSSAGSKNSSKRPSNSSKRSATSKGSKKASSGVKKRTKSSSGSATALPEPSDNSGGPRPFPCPFSHYGCTSSFSSKNEWKRHVKTQHLKCAFWRCDLCSPEQGNNDFNRKDLFTQHLRRMHTSSPQSPSIQVARNHTYNVSTLGSSGPVIPSSSSAVPVVTEDTFELHSIRCRLSLREPPLQSSCLFCSQSFSGLSSWDDRMDHMGRHLEDKRKAGESPPPVEQWREDPTLENWLLEQGLIKQTAQGRWKIVDGSGKGRVADSARSRS